ncbi:MAG: AbiH family protein [Fibrobacteraceae bacterium]|nr:AbiH family protein [Fibrobacteraceae bacterium]
MKKLFIIGNGFDLHHDIKCSYDDYKKYLEQHDLKWVVDFFERCFFAIDLPEEYTKIHKGLDACDHDRSKYAKTLAANYALLPSLNTWRFIEVILGCINGIPDDVAEISEKFASTITSKISDWMSEELGNITANKKMNLPIEDCSYLTFNYTDTLEKIYNIPPDIVNHIHNRIGENLIFGHANYQAIQECSEERLSVPEVIEDYPEFGLTKEDVQKEINETAQFFDENKIMEKYFRASLKDVKAILASNQSYFEALSCVEEIYVLGHSLSSVDYDYFKEIEAKAPNANWTISYYNDSAKEDIEETAFYKKIKSKAIFKTWREIEEIFS